MSIIKVLTKILLFSFTSISFFPDFSDKKSTLKDFEQYRIDSKEITVNDPKLDIEYLQYDVISNKTEIQKASEKVDDLTVKLDELNIELDILKEKNKYAYFNCKDLKKGFTVINADSGILYVSIKEVKPYLDGYKITLAIGNPNLVTYINPEINLSWNIPPHKQWEKQYAFIKNKENTKENLPFPLWKDTLQQKSYCANKRFLPGIWNEIELDIANVTIDQLEYCTLSITTGTVLLSLDNRID